MKFQAKILTFHENLLIKIGITCDQYFSMIQKVWAPYIVALIFLYIGRLKIDLSIWKYFSLVLAPKIWVALVLKIDLQFFWALYMVAILLLGQNNHTNKIRGICDVPNYPMIAWPPLTALYIDLAYTECSLPASTNFQEYSKRRQQKYLSINIMYKMGFTLPSIPISKFCLVDSFKTRL